MKHKYGEFTPDQISATKARMRKQIYFLLLCVESPERYQNITVDSAFKNVLYEFGGLNNLLGDSPALVRILSLLEAALTEYHSDAFNFATYRKLVLDAGSEVLTIEEV